MYTYKNVWLHVRVQKYAAKNNNYKIGIIIIKYSST